MMKKNNTYPFIGLCQIIIWCSLTFACSTGQKSEKAATKKIFYLNSYHAEYGTSAQILSGIQQSLKGKNAEIQVYYLDAKRITEEDRLAQNVLQILAQIENFGPDVIIASDDDAVKRVIVPHFKGKDIPVVFCGVNWSAAPYGLPTSNITGMVEVVPVVETIQAMKKYYPQLSKLYVLSENTLSEKKNQQFLDTAFQTLGLQTDYILVDNFVAWKQKFIEAQKKADLIYLPTNGGITGWKEEEAIKFVAKHIRKPIIACDDFMMAYAVMGLTKVASEQGAWAGKTTLDILSGMSVEKINVTKNTQTHAWFNPYLAQKIQFSPDSLFIHSSKIISNFSNLSNL